MKIVNERNSAVRLRVKLSGDRIGIAVIGPTSHEDNDLWLDVIPPVPRMVRIIGGPSKAVHPPVSPSKEITKEIPAEVIQKSLDDNIEAEMDDAKEEDLFDEKPEHDEPEEDNEPTDQVYTREELKDMPYRDLQAIAESLGLSKLNRSGSKLTEAILRKYK